MQQPFLVGEKIYLRAILESDLNENYQQWFNDEDVCRFNSHHRFPYHGQNMREYYENTIKSRSNLVLAIIDKLTDQHIGNIALQDIDSINRSAELAIIIGDKNFWDKGVGKEACQLVLDHGFNNLNLYRMQCGTSDENVGMQHLAETLGFKREGIARSALFKNGSYRDVINYGLIKNEYV